LQFGSLASSPVGRHKPKSATPRDGVPSPSDSSPAACGHFEGLRLSCPAPTVSTESAETGDYTIHPSPALPSSPGTPLFTTKCGAQRRTYIASSGHVEPSSLKKQHRKVLRLAGVRPFVLYSLRHTFLTRLGESGCDVWTLARIAGHSSNHDLQSLRSPFRGCSPVGNVQARWAQKWAQC